MRMPPLKFAVLTIALLGAWLAGSAPAAAHFLPGDGNSFSQGLLHPLSGLDHELAMVAVGLWAAQVGGRALWVLPIAFPVTMVAGALLGYFGIPLPLVEIGIAASVVVLGLCIALAVRPSLVASAMMVGLFALLHGHAHGAELTGGNPVIYGLGFVLATVALHLTGIGLAHAVHHATRDTLIRIGGSGIAMAGIFLMLR